MKKQYSCI